LDFDTIKTITQLQTLALTIPMLVLSIMVLAEIKKPAYDACFIYKGERKNQMCWILIGLFFGFTGKVFESVWWSIPWTMAYIDHPRWFEFNSYGVFFNLVFRQLFFTISAYCHLRAFIPSDTSNTNLRIIHYILVTSLLLGEGFILALYMAKNCP